MIPGVGERFRQFHIIEKVGEGGMGEVYRAEDTRLGRDVALKFLTRFGRMDADDHERLRREARSLAALSHANIVTIYDIDEAEGVPYLVLEWVPGGALSDRATRGRYDEEAFLRIALPVAEALAAAHERDIVHRDVKPGNVLVSEHGRVKLVDFGLARLHGGDARLTKTTAIVGTVAYMSPEQATGAEVGPASDIFSFGSLAYELLAGEPPFQRTSEAATLYAIVNEAHAPLGERRPDLAPGLVAVVERCLRKAPEARFANGSALAAELRRASRRTSADTRSSLEGQPAAGRGVAPDPQPAVHRIRYCVTADGARIAYSVVGKGPLLVRVLGWFTHLEMEWDWPALRLLWELLAEKYSVVRYDGRGIGLSEQWAGEFTEESRQLDLDAVLDAVGAERAILFGISEGGWTASLYASRHPERIGRLIVYGGYSRGARHRPGFDAEETEALMTLMKKGWGRDTAVFRQIFTNMYFRADAEPGLIAHFNQLQRASADPETAVRYQASLNERGEGREFLERLRVPTLVIHCRDDQIVEFNEGRRMATLIPGAQFLPLPSGTHYFPTDRETTPRLVNAIAQFVGEAG